MRWEVLEDWKVVTPILPNITVEGCLVWLRPCEMRVLEARYGDGYDHARIKDRHRQFRVIPTSDIWKSV